MFCPAYVTGSWIVGANAWGDPVTMAHGCLGSDVVSGDPQLGPPSVSARTIIQSLIAEAR